MYVVKQKIKSTFWTVRELVTWGFLMFSQPRDLEVFHIEGWGPCVHRMVLEVVGSVENE